MTTHATAHVWVYVVPILYSERRDTNLTQTLLETIIKGES